MFVEHLRIVLRAGVHLVRLDRRSVTSLVEVPRVDLVSQLANGHPVVSVLPQDESQGFVQRQPLFTGTAGGSRLAESSSRLADQCEELAPGMALPLASVVLT